MAGAARYWRWVAAALLVRVALISFPGSLKLGTRPEVATPLTSLRRLAEGYWLKKSSMSPYSGSMYHGSPLLLSILGPLTVTRTEGQSDNFYCGLIFVIADFITAMLLRLTGQNLQLAYRQFLRSKKLLDLLETSRNVDAGDVASLVFLWNPFGILTCAGVCSSPIENLMVVLSLYGACSSLPSLSAFGWVIATHLSLYPAILIVPIILLLGYGPDSPPKKLFLLTSMKPTGSHPLEQSHEQVSSVGKESELQVHHFSWRPALSFILWSSIWSFYTLVLCSIFLKDFGSLSEMFKKTYGFILSVEDLSPNIGVQWLGILLCTWAFWACLLMNFKMSVSLSSFSLGILEFHSSVPLCTIYGYGGGLGMQTSILQLVSHMHAFRHFLLLRV